MSTNSVLFPEGLRTIFTESPVSFSVWYYFLPGLPRADTVIWVGFAPGPNLAHASPATQQFPFRPVKQARVSSIGRSQVYEGSVASPGSSAIGRKAKFVERN